MKMKITLHGVSYEVEVEILDEGDGFYGGQAASLPKIVMSHPQEPSYLTSAAALPPRGSTTILSNNQNQITAPVGGTIIEIKMHAGDKVQKGQDILVLEAMKMQTAISSPVDGVIKSIPVAAGDTVREGQVIVEFA